MQLEEVWHWHTGGLSKVSFFYSLPAHHAQTSRLVPVYAPGVKPMDRTPGTRANTQNIT